MNVSTVNRHIIADYSKGIEIMKKNIYNLKQKITLSIRPDIIRRLDEEAEKRYVSRSQAAEMILREFYLGVMDNGEANADRDRG